MQTKTSKIHNSTK